MKKSTIAILLLIAFGLLSPMVLKVRVSAAQPGYAINNYRAITVPTIDGAWTTADE